MIRPRCMPLGSLVTACALAWPLLLAAVAAGEDLPADAKSLVPWDKMDRDTRAKLEEVVDHATIYHRSRSEVFVCSPELYLLLLHDPVLTIELWRGTGASDATLKEVTPGHYEGKDGHASKGQWEFAYKSPELNVIYAEGEYRGPLLGTNLETKSVLVLRTVFFEERDGKKYVKHQLDGFVKAEAGNLKPLAKTLRPIFAKSVEATMQETLWFVSLMCRYAAFDPAAAMRAAEQSDTVADSTKARLRKLLEPLAVANAAAAANAAKK